LTKFEVRALTLWEPWATFIALLLKEYETRPKRLLWRGQLYIHAAQRKVRHDDLLAIKEIAAGTPLVEKIF
jgi:hypothetical protein